MAQQRVSAAVRAGDRGAPTPPEAIHQQATQVQPEVNYLMPSSLHRVPSWFEYSGFRHNSRMLMGVIPGAILLLTVTGKPMLAAILGGAVLTLLIRHLQQSWLSMASTVGHVVFLEVVNVYCMVPLIWRSVLNLPLYAFFHVFIGMTGIWWWLQEKEFCNQDPRFVILLEQFLFSLFPAVSVVMVTWISGILFGRAVLAFVVMAAGIVIFSLYLVPLQSSFCKPNTPSDTALIQPRVVVWVYTVLELSLPPLVYTATADFSSLQSYLLLSLLVISPPFLLSLLEAQGLPYWFGLGASGVQVLRLTTGTVVMVLVTACVSLAQPSSYLPLLLLPILFVTMTLGSLAEHAPLATPTLAMGGALAVLYTVGFTQLPWVIVHYSAFLSLPLSLLQLVLWSVAVLSVAIMVLWAKVTPPMWVVYNGAFVLCEFILTWDEVYPLHLSVVTAVVAFLVCWRLYSVGNLHQLPCLLSMCVHVTKLSLLFPCSHSPSPFTASFLPLCSTFLTSFLLLRLLLFDHTPPLGSGRLLSYSGLLLVGLLLSVDTVLSPLWGSLTHTLPTNSSLLATVLGVVALYINYGLSLLTSQDKPPFISSLPPALGVMAALLWALQPEFSIAEMVGSVMVVIGNSSDVPEALYLMAWKNLLTWLTLLGTAKTLIRVNAVTNFLLTTVSLTCLGVLVGLLSAISLLQTPPTTFPALLYGLLMGACGTLCGRAFSIKQPGNLTDYVLYLVFLALCAVAYGVEWTTLPHLYMPWKPLLESYAKPCTLVVCMCALLLAVVFRVRMYRGGEQPYLPLLANVSCLLFFLTGILQQLSHVLEITVLLCSLVFLLTQPDGIFRPKRSYVFVAPCLLASVLVLYVTSAGSIISSFQLYMKYGNNVYLAARVGELLALALSIPGQLWFIYSLWSGRQYSLPVHYTTLFVLPNGLLPQLASTTGSTILGSVGIFSFSLNMIGGLKSN